MTCESDRNPTEGRYTSSCSLIGSDSIVSRTLLEISASSFSHTPLPCLFWDMFIRLYPVAVTRIVMFVDLTVYGK